MGDADAFARAILADPADEAPWLVFADWLDERDDPRGPFVRRYRAWAKLSPRNRAYPKHEVELFRLLAHCPAPAPILRGLRGAIWSPFSDPVAVLLFLNPGQTEPPDPPALPPTLRGVLQQYRYRFPTVLTVRSWTGHFFRGRLREDLGAMHGLGARGTFSVRGVAFAGHVAFVTSKVSGLVATPGLYSARITEEGVVGQWRVARTSMRGTFQLASDRPPS